MRRLSAAVLACLFIAWPASGAQLSKSYSYFNIGGKTMEEIQQELDRRGPKLKSTGRRHPGATLMEFNTNIKYAEKGSRCEIIEARVQVKAKVILPRWRTRGRSDSNTRLLWDTLAADIKRHEESHVVIAKTHARELEQTLLKTYPQRDCSRAEAKAREITDRVLAKHDAAQARFDRIEGINFERRIMRLLNYRMERAAK